MEFKTYHYLFQQVVVSCVSGNIPGTDKWRFYKLYKMFWQNIR